jgi:uncharacterized membrane protein
LICPNFDDKQTIVETKRLYFIDTIRAFAILMMLQGHFIDTLLATQHRDTSNMGYITWQYFRGITAPVFFTISGLIFTYLLLKAKDKGTLSLRIRKGLIRGFMLIGIGYSLRIPIFRWLTGSFGTYFLVIDVLQCIGISLLLIVCIYLLAQKNTLVFSIGMFCIATVLFLCEPLYRAYAAEGISLFFANYLTKANGSVFTIIPWFGYMAYGSFVSTLFYRYGILPKFKTMTVASLFIVGSVLLFFSTDLLLWLFSVVDYWLFFEVANYNYLFIRLGNVLLIFGLFYSLESYTKHPVILKIGQKTLSIYVVHFIVLYGSFTGLGLNRILGKSLTFLEAFFGAIFFLVIVSFISIHYTKIMTPFYLFIKEKANHLKMLVPFLKK